MNKELIKRLIAESTMSLGHPQIDGSYFDKEKFAELIVRECADTAKNCFVYWPMDGSLQRTGCANAIKKHFGVG